MSCLVIRYAMLDTPRCLILGCTVRLLCASYRGLSLLLVVVLLCYSHVVYFLAPSLA